MRANGTCARSSSACNASSSGARCPGLAATHAAIASPLLETPIDGAKGILLGVTGGPDLSLVEVSEVAQVVADAADPEANIIFGATIDPDLQGQVWVTVVAANFTGSRSAPSREPEPAAAAAPRARGQEEPRQAPVTRFDMPYPSGPGGSRRGGGGVFDLESEPADPDATTLIPRPDADDPGGGRGDAA